MIATAAATPICYLAEIPVTSGVAGTPFPSATVVPCGSILQQNAIRPR